MGNESRSHHIVRRASEAVMLDGRWDGPAWKTATPLTVGLFHAKSSPHRPKVQVKLAYDAEAVCGIFLVRDRYVTCTRTEYQSSVCRDSCVEFFVQPKPDKGYLNFEMNCGGALLTSYITDATRTETGFRGCEPVPWELGSRVGLYHSMPYIVKPEVQEETTWVVEFRIPLAVFEHYTGPLGALAGQEWRANLYKCADDSSHPHWASWSPIGEELNFHQPDRFGVLHFE